MKAFDANGVADLTHIACFERQGIDPTRAREAAAQLYQQMQSIGAHYARFDLLPAEPPFTVDGQLFIIIPYVQVMEVKGRCIQADAFFMALSADQGRNWKFVDGAGASDEGVHQAIPGYTGPLPTRRRPVP